jgi:hypothetical protein
MAVALGNQTVDAVGGQHRLADLQLGHSPIVALALPSVVPKRIPDWHTGCVTDASTSPSRGSDLVTAVRSVLLREVERVDDPVAGVPGGDPSDTSGWHPYTVDHDPRSAPGRPFYDAESWRWFRLIDLAVLDGTILVKFGWDEPGTPPLNHLAQIPVPRYTSLDQTGVALIVRTYLRYLLAPLDALKSAPSNATPGWRNRVMRTWLEPNLVLISPPDPDLSQSVLDRAWNFQQR